MQNELEPRRPQAKASYHSREDYQCRFLSGIRGAYGLGILELDTAECEVDMDKVCTCPNHSWFHNDASCILFVPTCSAHGELYVDGARPVGCEEKAKGENDK